MATKKNSSNTRRVKEYLRGAQLPLRIPISHDNIQLGTLEIDLKISQDMAKNIKTDYLLMTLGGIRYLSLQLKKDLELSLILSDEIRETKSDVSSLFPLLPPPSDYRKKFEIYWVYPSERDFFEQVKTYGPQALRTPQAFIYLEKKLKDKSVAGPFINRLARALKEFVGVEDKLEPVGAPGKDPLKKLGGAYVKSLYNLLTKILKNAKRIRRNRPRLDINESVNIAIEKYINAEIEEAGEDPSSKKRLERAVALKNWLEFWIKGSGWTNPIAEVILEDEELKREFKNPRFEPHKLAKLIIAKVFDSSEETIRSILYR
jgi:hypothetical protein